LPKTHDGVEFKARLTGRLDAELNLSDVDVITEPELGFEQTLQDQVLTHRPPGQRLVLPSLSAYGRPERVMFCWIGVERASWAAVDGAINLIVPGHAENPYSDGLWMIERGDRFFSNRAAVRRRWVWR
jgi:hypothetical protein